MFQDIALIQSTLEFTFQLDAHTDAESTYRRILEKKAHKSHRRDPVSELNFDVKLFRLWPGL